MLRITSTSLEKSISVKGNRLFSIYVLLFQYNAKKGFLSASI